MGQKRYLIDTNAVIDYLGNRLPAAGMSFMNDVVDNLPAISIITKIELLGFNASGEHYQVLKEFVADTEVLPLTEEIVDICILLRKQHKIKLPDAIIAATAIANKLELISRNISDFKHIEALSVFDPHQL